MEVNCIRFEGWVVTCPNCGYENLLNEEDIAFHPEDDEIHFITCEHCKEEIEIMP